MIYQAPAACLPGGGCLVAMWQANKISILVLLIGLAGLVGAYVYLAPQDELLARRVLYTGICALLFVVAVANWLSLKK